MNKSGRNLNDEQKRIIDSLCGSKSYSEIATTIGCSAKTVYRYVRRNNLQKSAEAKESMQSRIRLEQVKAEKRRGIFGLDQRTYLKVFSNKERNILRYCLKRRRYIFLSRGDTVAYFDDNTQRKTSYEERGLKLGLRFQPISNI